MLRSLGVARLQHLGVTSPRSPAKAQKDSTFLLYPPFVRLQSKKIAVPRSLGVARLQHLGVTSPRSPAKAQKDSTFLLYPHFVQMQSKKSAVTRSLGVAKLQHLGAHKPIIGRVHDDGQGRCLVLRT